MKGEAPGLGAMLGPGAAGLTAKTVVQQVLAIASSASSLIAIAHSFGCRCMLRWRGAIALFFSLLTSVTPSIVVVSIVLRVPEYARARI